jgi:hypothetical protein
MFRKQMQNYFLIKIFFDVFFTNESAWYQVKKGGFFEMTKPGPTNILPQI